MKALVLSQGALFARSVDAQEYKEQNRESPKRRPSIAKEGERNADDGGEANDHAHIDEHVEQQDAHDAVAIDAPISVVLEFGKVDEP